MRLRRLINTLLYGSGRRLRRYEQYCIDAVIGALPTHAAAILRTQVDARNHIQRFLRDRRVVFHFWEGTQIPLFRDRSDELTIARVILTTDPASTRFRCDLVLHDGRVSSLEFGKPPRVLMDVQPKCVSVDLFRDPSEALIATPAESECSGELLAAIRDLAGPLSSVIAPLDESAIQEFLRRLECLVPEDYVRLLRETNGFVAGSWRFLGTGTRRLMLDEGNYQVLAEADPFSLCVQEDGSSQQLFLVDQIRCEATPAGNTFRSSFFSVVEKVKVS